MKIKIEDDGFVKSIEDDGRYDTELPVGVKKRVITIERPAEKTPGERLYNIVNDALWPRWDALQPTRQRDWDRYAEEFLKGENAWHQTVPRDWEERRTFIGKVSHRFAGKEMVVVDNYGLDLDSARLLRWVDPSKTVRVTVDRLKDT